MLLRIKEESIVINTDHIRWMYYDKESDVTKIYMGVNYGEVKGDVTFAIMEAWNTLRDIHNDEFIDKIKVDALKATELRSACIQDCTSCVGFGNENYAQSFCHDCIKGIQNHYEEDKKGESDK